MTTPELRHRLAAILVADVVGYSRLMAGDQLATLTALDAARTVFQQRIEASQGQVVDMAGDSVLAVFETANYANEYNFVNANVYSPAVTSSRIYWVGATTPNNSSPWTWTDGTTVPGSIVAW